MNEQLAVSELVEKVREYARGRHSNVERGAETPELAALLLQKYGTGIVDAVATIFGTPRAADPISRVVDEETEHLDFDWRVHAQARWAGRPAEIVSHNGHSAKRD
ncbi:hypothetical protein [Massilia sp. DWR3-1-1]|uniref:hypothetical protein n=1 Tax=Massilia sp. DWR3-1-1 TaxID=2804559 RepID=UPI003CEB0FCB